MDKAISAGQNSGVPGATRISDGWRAIRRMLGCLLLCTVVAASANATSQCYQWRAASSPWRGDVTTAANDGLLGCIAGGSCTSAGVTPSGGACGAVYPRNNPISSVIDLIVDIYGYPYYQYNIHTVWTTDSGAQRRATRLSDYQHRPTPSVVEFTFLLLAFGRASDFAEGI